MKDLGVDGRGSLPLLQEGQEGVSTSSIPDPLQRGFETAGILKRLRHSSAMDEIYRRIDHALSYPAELAQKEIEGTVKTRIQFLPTGQLAKPSLKGTSRYLENYVYEILREAFLSRIHSGLSDQPLYIDCHFYFSLTRNRNASPDGQSQGNHSRSVSGISSQKLYFKRYVRVEGQWKVGPLAGFLVAPSVAVDLGWFVKALKGDSPELSLGKFERRLPWPTQTGDSSPKDEFNPKSEDH